MAFDNRLTGLIARLMLDGYDVGPLNYREVREAAQGGRIPVHRREPSPVYLFDPKDTPAIAAAFGLRKRPPSSSKPASRQAVAA